MALPLQRLGQNFNGLHAHLLKRISDVREHRLVRTRESALNAERARVTPELANIFTPVSSLAESLIHSYVVRSPGILHFSDETGEGSSNTTVFVSLFLFMLLGALGREKYGIDEFRYDISPRSRRQAGDDNDIGSLAQYAQYYKPTEGIKPILSLLPFQYR